jgi:leader peptidase (prepilin peptidase)/N-methyltransferase
MRALDLSPPVLHAMGVVAGAGAGLAGGRLADVLPGRYDIEHLVEGRARSRRNLVLAVVAALIGAWLAHLVTLAPETSIERAAFYFLTNLTLCVGIVTAATVDLEHMILPNELTLGGALLALATSHWRAVGLVGALIGTAVGVALYKRLRGRSGMGLGDAKLALLAGAWLGAEGAIFVVFAGAVQAALCALVMRLLGKSFAVPASVRAELEALRAKADAGDEEARALLADDPMAADVGDAALATMRLPMGPFLVLACLEFVFARRQILELYNRFIDP